MKQKNAGTELNSSASVITQIEGVSGPDCKFAGSMLDSAQVGGSGLTAGFFNNEEEKQWHKKVNPRAN
jgi:hypothetical protein